MSHLPRGQGVTAMEEQKEHEHAPCKKVGELEELVAHVSADLLAMTMRTVPTFIP